MTVCCCLNDARLWLACRYDDKDAFINTYDNKFVFETKRLDIYAVAKRPVTSETMKSIERVFYHPDVLPNNPEVYETSIAASRVVGWFRRFFLYVLLLHSVCG